MSNNYYQFKTLNFGLSTCLPAVFECRSAMEDFDRGRNEMSTSNLIDFFEQEIEATTELKNNLESLLQSLLLIDQRYGRFALNSRAIFLTKRIINLITATENIRQ